MDISFIQKIKLGWNFIRGNYLNIVNGFVDIICEWANKALNTITDKESFGKICKDIVIACKCAKAILTNHSDSISPLRFNASVSTIAVFETAFTSLEDANLTPEEVDNISNDVRKAIEDWKAYKKG